MRQGRKAVGGPTGAMRPANAETTAADGMGDGAAAALERYRCVFIPDARRFYGSTHEELVGPLLFRTIASLACPSNGSRIRKGLTRATPHFPMLKVVGRRDYQAGRAGAVWANRGVTSTVHTADEVAENAIALIMVRISSGYFVADVQGRGPEQNVFEVARPLAIASVNSGVIAINHVTAHLTQRGKVSPISTTVVLRHATGACRAKVLSPKTTAIRPLLGRSTAAPFTVGLREGGVVKLKLTKDISFETKKARAIRNFRS